MQAEKLEKLKTLISATEKTIGKNSIVFGDVQRAKCDVISTGSLKIDEATGIGGVPRGRLTEIIGWESSGKSTLSLQLIANVHRSGGVAAYIDAEHALDPTYATNLGVDLSELVLAQPETAEQGLQLCEDMMTCGIFDLIIIDSTAAMIPRAILEGNIGDAFMGIQARLMSQACPKLVSAASKSGTALVFINQLRSKIGGYGDPTTTPGGNAVKFYSSMRIQTTRSTVEKSDGEATGNKVKIKVIKNKLARPFVECETEIIYGEGFDLEGEIIDYGVKLGLVERSGTWYSYQGNRLGQGKDNARQFLMANPDVAKSIELAARDTF